MDRQWGSISSIRRACFQLWDACNTASPEASFHAITNEPGAIEEAVNALIQNGLTAVLSKLAAKGNLVDHIAESSPFDCDIWFRGLLWPALEASWPLFSAEESPRCVSAFIAEASAVHALLKKHAVFRDFCTDMLEDLEAYSVVLQAAMEPPSVRPSEAHGVPPLRRRIWAKGCQTGPWTY